MRSLRALLVLLGVLAPAPAAAQPDIDVAALDAPEDVVQAFLRDYKAWNDRTHEASRTGGLAAAVARGEREWAVLLARYCRPGFVGEPIAFGSEAMHDPVRETVVSVTREGDTARVRTRHVSSGGVEGFVSDFEYVLAHGGGRWWLEAVDYLVDGERYPSL